MDTTGPNTAKAVARSALRLWGYEVHRARKADTTPRDFKVRRAWLAQRYGVAVAFDVGANRGDWATDLRAHGYRGAIVSFEPTAAAFAQLAERAAADKQWHALNLALGASIGRRTINVAGNSWSSSLLGIEERHVAVAPESAYVGSEQIQVTTLDDVCRDRLEPGERAYLKADVQGYELEVLRGAGAALAQVDLLELELSVVPLYTGQPLHREITGHVEGLGFQLVGLQEGFMDVRGGRLLQYDALFARRASRDAGEART